jgi:dinuclear metal center YbgI/SA1388 family protein
MTIKEITNLLEQWAPLSLAEDFDNVGLLVGDSSHQVSNVLVAHDALENVVDEAVAKNCNLIVSFHPIIFSGLKRLNGSNYVERAVVKAIQHNVAIYAIHTALDNMPGGVNFGMTRALELKDCRILIPKKENLYRLTTYAPTAFAKALKESLFAAGAGHIGDYDQCSFSTKGEGTFRPGENTTPFAGEKGKQHQEAEIQLHFTFEKQHKSKILKALVNAHPYEEISYEITALENTNQHRGMGMVGTLKKPLSESDFLSLIKKTFKTGGIRHSALLNKSIKKVAVLGGSGAFAIEAAVAQGADAYVTADLKYHDYYKAENQILLADVGHYESERFTKTLIANYLTEKIRSFAVLLSKENTNPINYF